jgi:hypothetical protein
MCNLYSVTKGQSAIRDLFSVKHDRASNLPPLPAILPDHRRSSPIKCRSCGETGGDGGGAQDLRDRSSWPLSSLGQILLGVLAAIDRL